MSQDLESVMKNALDGKFYSFCYNNSGGMKVIEKKVSEDFRPQYNVPNQFETSGKQGGKARQDQNRKRRELFWTPEKIEQLKKLRAHNHGARIIGRMLGTSRTEVGIQLNKMGILSTIGQPYNSRPNN